MSLVLVRRMLIIHRNLCQVYNPVDPKTSMRAYLVLEINQHQNLNDQTFGPKGSHDSEKVQVGQHDWAVNIPFRVYNLCIMCTHTQFNVHGTGSSGNDVNNIEIIGTCTVLSSGQYKVNKIERALATSFNYGAKLRQLSEYTLCPLF